MAGVPARIPVKRRGWIDGLALNGSKRVLNKREQSTYEQYCAWCHERGLQPAVDYMWYVENQKIPSV